MMTPKLKSDFSMTERPDWRVLVESGLRGGVFPDLQQTTEDGILRGPLKTASDLPPQLSRLARTDLPLLDGRTWHISAPVTGSDLDHANAQLLENLEGGASAVRIENTDTLKTKKDVKRLLEGVLTDLVPLHFSPSTASPTYFDAISPSTNLSTAVVWAGLDPFRDEMKIKAHLDTSPDTWKLMQVSARPTHERGGTDVLELAHMAAYISQAMRTYDASTVCQHLVVELAADRDTHSTIAKFRAARRIMRNIAKAFNADGSKIPICAVTSGRMMQTQDAWTNLLRVMSAGFGAVIGGADIVTTRPFTDSLGEATSFAHRIARNMQLMMMEESHLGQVSDPAHGSYWHEHMSEELAQAAWTKFQTIESSGGIQTYIENGNFAQDISAANSARIVRADPILGVTLHPSDSIKTPEVRS